MPEKLNKTNSKVEIVKIDSELLFKIRETFKQKAFIVAYLVNEVLFGTIENNEFYFPDGKEIDEKYLLQIRVFDENKELFLRKKNDGFAGRIREDEGGDAIEYVEANQIILGTQSEIEGQYTILTEKRLFNKPIKIPQKFNEISERKRIAIKTRNYIGHNGALQAEYIDSRFVKFCEVSE